MQRYEVPYERLKTGCEICNFVFETTEEVEPYESIIGQDRAVRAMEFGLNIKRKGYNIYMSGLTGSGKTNYAQTVVKKYAVKEPVPMDWCYVYNFENPNQPMAIGLKPGLGVQFVEDIEKLVSILKIEIPKVLDTEQYESEKNSILKKFQNKRLELLEKLNEIARNFGFVLKDSPGGILRIPIINGKPITPQEYESLSDDIKRTIEERANELDLKAVSVFEEIQDIEKEVKNELKELDVRIVDRAVSDYIFYLKKKYEDNEKVIKYLNMFQQDILKNIDKFKPAQEMEQPFPFLKTKSQNGFFIRYKVNLIVDNSKTEGAPVVIEFNPTYKNLFGSLEYENEFGVAVTDFTKIKAGAVHKANGGYLILQAKDVFNNPFAWEGLKRVLKTDEIVVENIRDPFGIISFASLRPEAIPVSLKIILIGNPIFYRVLYDMDEDFKKFFKIKVDFDAEMDYSVENVNKMAGFISNFCRRENIKHFHRSGVAKLIEYSSRLIEDRKKMTTRFNDLIEIIYEADAWAELDGSKFITEEHVKKAIEEKEYRVNRIEQKILEMEEQGILMIDIEGKKVGQVNGLSVIDVGDHSFGRPTKITVTTYMGKEGIVNIEREAKLSGNIHDKGVLIITGYLGQKYAQEFPLSLSARICFEQVYDGVDGDSASSTELYALLSSLAEIPIKQYIAVTGSVNQKGEIQPVGGVTRKVEGFFELCKRRGLTGEQGVIIPYQNLDNLILKDEVLEAVKEGKFHIYAVKNIDEGIEILTDVPAGKRKENGEFEEGTIHYFVEKKLKSYIEKVKNLEKDKI